VRIQAPSPDVPSHGRTQAPTALLDAVHSAIGEDLRAVDALIRRRLDSDVVLIRRIAEYIVAGGGKRLRPAVVLLSAGAFGYRGKWHHELAAVIEFIHTATLLHDDVVDQSDMRRGRRTANAAFGNAASVLVGDFLYSRAFQMMVGVGSMRVMSVLADATNAIAEGEVLQLLNARNAAVTEAEYLEVVKRKTAKLFEAAGQLGAILGEASAEAEKAMAHYGLHLGTAFQVIDDVLDYSGDEAETGKNLGDDLSEGKPTLPLIHAMQRGTPEQAQLVREAIENGSRADFPPVMKIVSDTGALEYARGLAERESRAACSGLEKIPDTSFRDGLRALAEFAFTRCY
jgi:octaprenyl-diphosphate synthase